eukprot:CAMPEP_0173380064 /NCGR_PEP_ID=MMETSP1356-20130122/2835_1 /TAXON_ID=77927 ORGANISM="Hemiselmis virescens, Strain PCC157" /NCGR_SAMPLE_ID=MMETSP1356 /ASSEMBLY_ACC=CAM_ASM_000847 /LENGTH=71 /DNA_ID=CAMNT_0014333551 /DNA_START=166 /DNA_END=377 /DNA_ORIENTATION=+
MTAREEKGGRVLWRLHNLVAYGTGRLLKLCRQIPFDLFGVFYAPPRHLKLLTPHLGSELFLELGREALGDA